SRVEQPDRCAMPLLLPRPPPHPDGADEPSMDERAEDEVAVADPFVAVARRHRGRIYRPFLFPCRAECLGMLPQRIQPERAESRDMLDAKGTDINGGSRYQRQRMSMVQAGVERVRVDHECPPCVSGRPCGERRVNG